MAASETTTGPLYAVNLGATGLCLVHAYGTVASYGLEVEELAIDPTTGYRQFVVHGAYALVAWEAEAIYGVSNTPIYA